MPRINNETDLEYKRRVIDIKSESFCGAKWYNATIWLGSGMTTSCHHPLPHKVTVEEVEENFKALHNTHKKKAERKTDFLTTFPEMKEFWNECKYYAQNT
jgi:hypothetical protein